MPTEHTARKPTARRYSMVQKAVAVRMVGSLQAETGVTHGAVRPVGRAAGRYGLSRSVVGQAGRGG
jgi:hypothetical protein